MAPQIGFHGLAPRSRAHLCFTMVDGSNRRREEGDVSRGFRVTRATDWQGPVGFFVASPFPIWRRTHFPSTLNSCRTVPQPRHPRRSGDPEPLFTAKSAKNAKGSCLEPRTKNLRALGVLSVETAPLVAAEHFLRDGPSGVMIHAYGAKGGITPANGSPPPSAGLQEVYLARWKWSL